METKPMEPDIRIHVWKITGQVSTDASRQRTGPQRYPRPAPEPVSITLYCGGGDLSLLDALKQGDSVLDYGLAMKPRDRVRRCRRGRRAGRPGVGWGWVEEWLRKECRVT